VLNIVLNGFTFCGIFDRNAERMNDTLKTTKPFIYAVYNRKAPPLRMRLFSAGGGT
jgi:hypothetical protein